MPDPYREPMQQPPPPRDAMRVVLLVAGGIAGVIAVVAIAFGIADARASRVEPIAPVRSATPPPPQAPPPVIGSPPPVVEREEPKPVQDLPLVADDSATPKDFEVAYTSPNSMIPSYTVRVAANGDATMEYLSGSGVIAKLAPQVVRDLWHLVSRHQFFRWESNTTNDHPGMTDHFPLSLSATANGLQNTITCLDRCPTGTIEIIRMIRDQTHPQDWTTGGKKLPNGRATGRRDLDSLLDTR